MQAHAKEEDSTCLSLNLSNRTRCLKCTLVAESFRRTKGRQPCEREWRDEIYKIHLSKHIRDRSPILSIKIWRWPWRPVLYLQILIGIIKIWCSNANFSSAKDEYTEWISRLAVIFRAEADKNLHIIHNFSRSELTWVLYKPWRLSQLHLL